MISRRAFIGNCGAALAISGHVRKTHALGANDIAHVAIIGVGNAGRRHLELLNKLPSAKVIAICDVDSAALERAAKQVSDVRNPIATYASYREMLDKAKPDLVTIATPNHWHNIQLIESMSAGMHVYVESPVSHMYFEGSQMMKVERSTGRIVQTGMHARSNPAMQDAIEFIRQGNLGKVILARGIAYNARMSIGKTVGPQPIPKTVNYDKGVNSWLGPAPIRPLRRKRLHYDWRWDFTTGDGELGEQCGDVVDVCRWALGEGKLPDEVMSIGGRFGYDDDGETPNTQLAYFRYPESSMVVEVRGLPRHKRFQRSAMEWRDHLPVYRGIRNGAVIQCEGGYLVVTRAVEAKAYDHNHRLLKSFGGKGDPFENWLNASLNGKQLNADLSEGVTSSNLCHFGNIAQRIGNMADAVTIQREIQDNELLSEAFNRMKTHLLANGVDTERPIFTVSPILRFNSETQRFADNDPASKLLSPPQRKGYEIKIK